MIIALQTLVFFRESIFAVIDRLLRPYYKHFSLTFNRHGSVSDDEESEDHVFAEFDDEKGVVFFPPVYAQRYAAVSDCLMDERWCEKLEKVVDFGYHDTSFIKYLKEVRGIKSILGVDLESIPLRCSSDLLEFDEYAPKRENPLRVTLYQGNAADPDYRLIGCDAVIAIEMIEHMLPYDLERLVHNIFGFIQPWIAIITTPNGDFNPLFKAMEKNGLRRLDHFFEWSREQFHDWCTNIVVRYPQYTVSCRGVGPGPPGTLLYGCCSQLALFVSKDYHKQKDLDMNSLALVAKAPNKTNMSDIIGCLDSRITFTESNMLCSPNDIESYTELVFSDKQSCVTLVLSPAFSLETIEHLDKTAQCNLDTELGKMFMFEEEPCFGVLVPRKKVDNRVYVIEDVNSRLNCTTLQVKKFSKTTQNMLAKNRTDSLVHTREVVDEIKHLTKMLNFNNETKDRVEGEHIWHNINWGDDAPYWNQYYKIVREYNYPFETKSEESRILDLVSDEINRLIDSQFDDEFSADVNKIEIPIDHLMRVVQHITDDVDRVKDLLEWNGYEIADDVVIYSRLVVDNASVGSRDEWNDDAFSDWDTDVRSASFSDGSTIVPDYHGRCLHRALDQKVRNLRSMLSADEDISVELDRVVCRLLKMALKTTRRRQRPLPMKWLQCKMLDLLTLTEKAIAKKKHYDECHHLMAICYDEPSIKQEEFALANMREDDTVNHIMQKYRHLLRSSENTTLEDIQNNCPNDMDDILSHTSSKEFLKQAVSSELNFDEIIRSPSHVDIEPAPKHTLNARKVLGSKHETPLARTQAWVEEDVNVVRLPKHSAHGISSGDTDQSLNNIVRFKNKKSHRKHKLPTETKQKNLDVKRRDKSSTKILYDKYKANNVKKTKNKDKTSKTRLIKNVVKKKSSYNILIKTCTRKISSASFGKPLKRNAKKFILPESASRPIPDNIMKFYEPKICTGNITKELNTCKENNRQDNDSVKEVILDVNIANTKESQLIDIITDAKEETIALRRTIGTDADEEHVVYEQEIILGSLINVMETESFCKEQKIENVHSQTIFLLDINEPSTSKGVRHVSMDVQCGPDANNTFATLSATTSLTRLPKMFSTAIKIENSSDNIKLEKKHAEFGTCTNENANTFRILTPREKSIGIKIKDSETKIEERPESGTMTIENTEQNKKQAAFAVPSPPIGLGSAIDTQMLKPVSSKIKIEDSGSEFCESVESYRKSPFHFANLSKNTSDFQMSSVSKDVAIEQNLSRKYVRPKLSCGGVHIHSYKDKQTSEDVFYQGEWQRYRPKALVRRKAFNVVPKKVKEIANKKTKISFKEDIVDNKESKVTCKRVPNRNSNSKKIENEVTKVSQVKEKDMCHNVRKSVQYNSNTSKVTNILLTSTPLSKPNKVSFVAKKPSMTTFCMTKKESETPQRCCRKNYLPLYLKRKLASKNKNNILTKSNDSTTTMTESSKDKPISPLIDVMESKNEEDRKGLLDSLDFDFEPRENVSYVIFRNETETDKSPAAGSDSLFLEDPVIKRDITNKRFSSPHSQNSSPCSSPNSIDTVRARPTPKMLAEKRFSTSSNKSNLSNSQCESTTPKSKKFTKRAKSAKKTPEKDVNNKENVPESSRRSKDTEKNVKGAFMHTKNVFRAHVTTTECSPQSVNNSLSRQRPQAATKSNVRIPAVPCSSRKSPTSESSSRPSVYKKSPSKSRSSLQSENKSDKKTIKYDIPSTTSQRESTKKIETETKESVIINIVDNSLLAEFMNSSYKNVIDSHTSNILSAMRQIVEEKLDFIERSSDHVDIDSKTVVLGEDKLEFTERSSDHVDIDSKTVVLGEDTLESVSVSATTSFHDSSSLNNSFGTVILNDDGAIHTDMNNITSLNNSFGTVFENEDDTHNADVKHIQNIVDSTLDSILSNESVASLSKSRDLDLLSLKNTLDSILSNESVGSSSKSRRTDTDLDLLSLKNTLDSILSNESVGSFSKSRRTDTDLDLLSFKSLTSASKLSEYFLAESSLSHHVTGSYHTVQALNSVRDIFERKNQLSVQNPTGASGVLAVQAFSGFSMNSEPIAGDKPDRINNVDSETGSLALEYTRLATSEEVFVSGRSSGSYESCLIEDDTVVPYWLFQILSQQQSVDEEEEQEPEPPMPLAEPLFDVNGNVMEPGTGASAGAGDGRGIHSDHSQDSSGRGSTLSSSATSSGPRSEAILIDPTAFTAQYDLLREPAGSSGAAVIQPMPPDSPDSSFRSAEGAESSRNNNILNSSGEGCPRMGPYVVNASDVDADISSIDTDVPDSSDD